MTVYKKLSDPGQLLRYCTHKIPQALNPLRISKYQPWKLAN